MSLDELIAKRKAKLAADAAAREAHTQSVSCHRCQTDCKGNIVSLGHTLCDTCYDQDLARCSTASGVLAELTRQ